jgi:hypothetical protein
MIAEYAPDTTDTLTSFANASTARPVSEQFEGRR